MTAVQDIPISTITGTDTTLGAFAGQVVLVVNVASQCGLTPQYEALERLFEQQRDKGFTVVGFPANNFAGQEPGTNDEIAEFCRSAYSVAFPMFAKISVVGDDQHPLYRELTSAAPRAAGEPDEFREKLRGYGLAPNNDPDVLWNFEKFLIGRDGNVIGRFAPTLSPDDPLITDAIDAALAG